MYPDQNRRISASPGNTISANEAEVIALRAVAFIAADPEALAGLLRVTGIAPEMLREGLANPRFLAGVLAFLLENEARLVKFCAENDIAPASPAAARRILEGNDQESDSVSWI